MYIIADINSPDKIKKEGNLFKWIILPLLCLNLSALEVSMTGAKENFQNYSTLHIKEKEKFMCEEHKNDFDITTQIICAFSKQPANKFRKLENDFFEINSVLKDNTFFLIITPIFKIKLYPMVFDLSIDETVYQANVKLSDHWMIIGYKDKLPYIKNDKISDNAIDFPFYISKDSFPYVGGLDIKGNPVHIKKVQDVTDYLQIKKYYNNKKYELALSLTNEVIEKYPNTLFMSELLLYKIRIFNELKQFDNLIPISKAYLKAYSSDESVPEVLALTARAYGKTGLDTDADYFYDRLFSEHESSLFTKWGYIYRGEMLEDSGASSKAIEYYLKALNETSNITVAATAAYNLAKYKVSYSNPKEASMYVDKILNAQPSFFMTQLNTSLTMIDSFVQENDFLTPALIAKALLDQMNGKEDNYEELLKNRAIWLSKTDKKQDALQAINEYIEKYKDGSYIDEIQIAKDALFFDVGEATDANLSTKLIDYNKLIDTYKNDTIGNKAIYEKAKLLLTNGMYNDVLDFKQDILELDNQVYPDVSEIIKESAVGVMKNALKQKECQEVLNISSDYNITLSSDWDEGLYDCFMKGANFIDAKNIASDNIKSTDLEQRKKWLYRYIKVDFATGNYSELVDASKDLILLIEEDKDSQYNDVYRILFDTYTRLENTDKMIDTIAKVEKIYGIDYKDIDRYVAIVTIGSQLKDDNIIIKYATQVTDIQTSSNSFAQSPFVEFTLYQAYINKDDFNKALDVIKSLDTVELNNNQRSRQKYLLGSVYSRLWRDDEAKEAYQESINADPKSAWAKLAEEAKNI